MAAHKFLEDALGALGTALREQGPLLTAAAVVFFAVDAGVRLASGTGTREAGLGYLVLGALAVIYPAFVYRVATGLLRRRPSIGGLARFVGATLSLFVPGAAGVLVMVLASHPLGGVPATVGITLCAITWLLVVLLPAWPIVQALSPRFVPPLLVWRATKGHRWQLVLASSLAGVFTRFVPSTGSTKTTLEMLFFAALNAAADVGTLVFIMAVAVTAWRYASANVPALATWPNSAAGAEAALL